MAARLAFLLPDLQPGGAEKVTLELAAAAVSRGHDVDLLLAAKRGALLDAVPQGVRLVTFDVDRLLHLFGHLRTYFRQERPHALVAAMWPLPVLAIAAGIGLAARPRIIAAEHCSLRLQYAEPARTSLLLQASVRATYRFADALVGVSDGVAGEIADLAGLPRGRVASIANPVPRPAQSASPPQDVAAWHARPGLHILAAGRLKAVKNFRLAIAAAGRLRERGIPAQLAIIGEGEERAALEADIARSGLADHVLLPGHSATPGDWYAAADVFLLTSDYEGLGNVLVEALHFGLPVVSTDCPYGPREVLGDGRWGRLTPMGDAAALADAIAATMASPPRSEDQRRRAADYSVERAAAAYLALMDAPR